MKVVVLFSSSKIKTKTSSSLYILYIYIILYIIIYTYIGSKNVSFISMNPSPFARNTFWGMTIGMTVVWLGHYGTHPGTVQRFLSVPREIDAK